MADLLFVLHHSTDAPERAARGLYAAACAAREGHAVALWLSGEGVRLGVEGVAETLCEALPENAAESLAALHEAGAVLHLDRASFEQRQYEVDALRPGARVSGSERLGELLAGGRHAVTM